MARYRKKPIEVEAAQYTGDNANQIMWWVDQQANPPSLLRSGDFLELRGKQYSTFATPGDWIVRRADGEYQTWKPEQFHAAFELAEDAP